MPKKTTRSLAECSTIDQICELRYDNRTHKDCWILSDGYRVTIAEQRVGESPTQSITIPRKTFNKLIEFYTRQQRRTAQPAAK